MAQEDIVEESKPMDKKKKITLAVLLALLLSMSVYGMYSWWSGRHFRAAMAMVNDNVNFEDLSSDERRARFDAYRKIEKNLTKEQRGQIDEARERQFEKRDMQRMSTFFAMSPADQRKKMVEEIKAEEKRRQDFEKKRAEFMKNNPNAGQKRPGGGNGGGGQQQAGGKAGGNNGQGQGQGKGGNGGGGQPGGGGPPQGGPPGGRGNTSPEARNKRTSDRLDNSSPEYRAMRNEYRAMQNQIRAQMGLPANGGSRGGPPGGGGGGQPQQGGGGRPRG